MGTPFTKGAWYQNQSPTQTSDDTCGIFGVRDNLKARQRRRYFQQAGTKATVIQWEPIIIDIVDAAISKIERDATKGKADLAKWFTMMAADVLSSLAFGEAFDMVKSEKVSLHECPWASSSKALIGLRNHNLSKTLRGPCSWGAFD